jgi:hypothetical protein
MAFMAPLAIAATAASAGMQAIGAAEQGAAMGNYYQYQSGIAAMNQKIAQESGEYELRVGESQAEQSGMKTAQTLGRIRAAEGAGNIDINRGTPAAVQSSEHELGLLDQGTIRAAAERRAYGYKVAAVGDEAQSNLDLLAAGQSRTAGNIGAMGSIIGGAEGVSSKWMWAAQNA